KDRRARAFGEPRGPVTDGDQRQSAVVLYLFHLRAQGVDVGDHGAGGLGVAARQSRANGAATGQFVFQPQPLQFAAQQPDRLVGVARGAGRVQQVGQTGLQIVEVDRGAGQGGSFRLRVSGSPAPKSG